jgi:VWFA-related protein
MADIAGMAIPLSARFAWPLVSALLLGSGVSPSEEADEPAYTFRVSTSEVRLSFAASDQNHGVAALAASDFVVVDKDFIVRDFQSFTHSDLRKLEIAILVDSSESITPHFQQEIADLLDLLSQTAGVPEDNISIVSFQGKAPDLLCSGDCLSSDAVPRLAATHAGGFTPLFDAITLATDTLARKPDAHTQKILIVLSDGEDTISRNCLSDAVAAAVATGVEIYAVDLGGARTSRGATILYRLSYATGGRYFPARSGATKALHAILEDFRATYTVTYSLPSHAPGFHSVRIMPTHNMNLQFRSRSGYFYPQQSGH